MTDRPNFDVSGWMRLISDVQQLGLDTARSVADRFADLADSNLGSQGDSTQPWDTAVSTWRNLVDEATDQQTQEQLVVAAQGMTDAMLGMMRAAWDFFAESAAGAGSLSWGTGSADLGSAPPGGQTAGKVFIHVGRSAVPDEVRLRVGPVTSGSGDLLPDDAIEMAPSSVVDPEGGRSYPVEVRVSIPEDAVSGVYHGHLFARTVPPSAVPLRVEVGAE